MNNETLELTMRLLKEARPIPEIITELDELIEELKHFDYDFDDYADEYLQ